MSSGKRWAALAPLEIAWSVPLGLEPSIAALGPAGAGRGRSALEAVVRRALERPPCMVSFSGGRDSSAVLALATHVARREGLPEPIPATNRFPAVPSADEREWQELVIDHLRLNEWVRIELSDELDMLGGVATGVLRRHGILAPFNSHFHVPLMRAAAGGSLLTGIGGDEVFEPTDRAVLGRLIYGRRVPGRTQLRAVTRASLPRAVRRRQLSARADVYEFSWLRPVARRAIAEAYGRWLAREPIGYDVSMRRWWWRSRMLQCNLYAKGALAADHDVEVAHPFTDPDVLVSYGAQRGRLGPPGRIWALRELVGDLLPTQLLERETKSTFNQVFWTRGAREFVDGWSGQGVDHDLIDVERLREEWMRPSPDAHSFALLQQAYLASITSS